MQSQPFSVGSAHMSLLPLKIQLCGFTHTHTHTRGLCTLMPLHLTAASTARLPTVWAWLVPSARCFLDAAYPHLCQCPCHIVLSSSPHSSVFFTRPQALWGQRLCHTVFAFQHSPEWNTVTAHCRTSLDICWINEIFSPTGLYVLDPFFVYRMQRAGIPCPTVVLLKKHILVMSFIGHDQVPAPKLKEVKLSSEEMKDAYYQTLHVSCAVQSIQIPIFKNASSKLKKFLTGLF